MSDGSEYHKASAVVAICYGGAGGSECRIIYIMENPGFVIRRPNSKFSAALHSRSQQLSRKEIAKTEVRTVPVNFTEGMVSTSQMSDHNAISECYGFGILSGIFDLSCRARPFSLLVARIRRFFGGGYEAFRSPFSFT
jgi:hypothetical protein